MTSKKNRKFPKTAFKEMLLWLVLSFVLMLFLTRSSFLYPYNNWDDSNSYFSMGKSMFHGALIYRDLFDQKGPYLYFLYGLCSLISRTTFRGVFIMEVLLGAADLALLCRILELFCRPRTSIILTPLLFTCMCASKSFYWGGCAEEICLPFLLGTFYILLEYLMPAAHSFSGRPLPEGSFSGGVPAEKPLSGGVFAGRSSSGIFPARQVFLAGLCCGFVFNVKFTLMGFFLGFAVIVILSCRSFREFLRLAGWFLSGALIPFIPWLIYFGIRGGLDDWYRVYIYTNVFRYSSFGENTHGETAATRVYDLAKILYWLIRDNIQYFIFIIIGLLRMLVRPLGGKRDAASGAADSPARGSSARQRVLLRISPVLLFALTFFFIYIGGAHLPYYAFPLTVFAVTGMALPGRLIDDAAAAIRNHNAGLNRPANRPAASARSAGHTAADAGVRSGTGAHSCAVTVILLCASLAVSFLIYREFSWNRDFLLQPKDSVFLSRFTDDINRDREDGTVDPEHTTLLNVGCLDCGLYTTADIYPSCYWFQTQTLPGNEVTDAQNSYILEGRTDYVVVRDTIPESIYTLYEQIDFFHQRSGEYEFDYYLFRKKKLQ